MSKLNYPDRIILLSDTFGRQEKWHPFKSPDIDAAVATSVRSGISEVLRFDTFGAEGITDHILRSVIALHEENPDAGKTGVFINGAPRVKEGNGDPFYVTDIGDRVRIVATPLDALSAIRRQIASLCHLPNENNGLYDGKREQFRSSFTPRLLADNHGLNLVSDDPSIIPSYPENCRFSYADRFGNLVFFDNTPKNGNSISEKIEGNIGKKAVVTIGNVSLQVQIVSSLAEGELGSLIIYANDGNIEVVNKWSLGWSPDERLKKSAYSQFSSDENGINIGDAIEVKIEK